ncbi:MULTISPECIES: AAA family ATPase [unclassified Microcystis]|uniref:AAA family ATPase n=1 Tax=unclassified Microcystis TaxID=2643300 RepID=UPI0025872F2E|nr:MULTISPECIES: AAA family ATPase [unclassified Microcystis]MCA2762394.1 AAA family ATPase [Microcystis sp. M151S2]MCA2641394.1 AAA family ATPase [Microcystis sp. M087S2]MCA2673738.1 AAA family ATPase [Microcystis sp. M080S2]MCA2687961.1 AAA family ATPase [Microcystis sp. M037S2]MCA2736370.1 AAA family ATPase [Microcystis sp. M158S2]
MIKDLEISNFRCFENTKIEGFERVNLIGGKNNSGKTALLEAIFLYSYPYPNTIDHIRGIIRKQSLAVVQAIPKNAWDNLLFNLDRKNIIDLKGSQSNQGDKLVKISISDSLKDNVLVRPEDWQQLYNFIAKNKSVISILNIQTSFDPDNDSNDGQLNYFLIASSEGILALPDPGDEEPVIIAASVSKSLEELSESYTKIVFNEQEEEVLKALQILDPSIEKIESFFLGEPNLYLKRKETKRLPISLFGEAINRLIEIIFALLLNPQKIIFIDEIENGLHYTAYPDIWKTLFRLAMELDSQIFATTHSLEMIQAFADVGLEYYPEQGAYFELARSPRTDKIIGIKRQLSTLEYALKHGNEVRGE